MIWRASSSSTRARMVGEELGSATSRRRRVMLYFDMTRPDEDACPHPLRLERVCRVRFSLSGGDRKSRYRAMFLAGLSLSRQETSSNQTASNDQLVSIWD